MLLFLADSQWIGRKTEAWARLHETILTLPPCQF